MIRYAVKDEVYQFLATIFLLSILIGSLFLLVNFASENTKSRDEKNEFIVLEDYFYNEQIHPDNSSLENIEFIKASDDKYCTFALSFRNGTMTYIRMSTVWKINTNDNNGVLEVEVGTTVKNMNNQNYSLEDVFFNVNTTRITSVPILIQINSYYSYYETPSFQQVIQLKMEYKLISNKTLEWVTISENSFKTSEGMINFIAQRIDYLHFTNHI